MLDGHVSRRRMLRIGGLGLAASCRFVFVGSVEPGTRLGRSLALPKLGATTA